MMKRALYLDDQRTPTTTIPNYDPWYVVRNHAEFTDWITKNGMPDLISFDHDLADEHSTDYAVQVAENGYQNPTYDTYKELTGLACADWLVKYCQKENVKLCTCSIHSHNPVGSKNIQSLLNGFNKFMDWDETTYLGKHPFTIEKK